VDRGREANRFGRSAPISSEAKRRRQRSCRAFRFGSPLIFQALQRLAVPVEILNIVGMFPHVVSLQKSIEFIAGLKTQKPPGLEGGKRPGTIAFDGESFQRLARRVGTLGDVLGQFHRDLHRLSIAPFRGLRQITARIMARFSPLLTSDSRLLIPDYCLPPTAYDQT